MNISNYISRKWKVTKNYFYNNKTRFYTATFIAICLSSLTAVLYTSPTFNSKTEAEDNIELGAFPIVVPTLKYGFALDTFLVIEGEIKTGTFLGDILHKQHIDFQTIDQLVKNAADVFDVRKFRPEKPYTILSKDTSAQAEYFIYEPNVFEYIVFHLQGDLKVEKIKREVFTEVKTAAGVLESTLWQAMLDNGMTFELADKMEDALQWSIDFHHLQKNDQFKLVYEEQSIDGKVVGVGMVKAAYYKTGINEFYSIFHETETEDGYYDLEGRPMKSTFLKSPVKFSRISSHYNLNRFHPILKRRRPHFGTDYAAPYGTPILAVGNGVVEIASYTKGNGNYVKIKHDKVYKTQYLHMQKFAAGIHAGAQVKQGQVIGYIGSTGLATGPHVCFRFWKNNKQVNHLRLKFPPTKALEKEELPAYFISRDQYLEMLSTVDAPKIEEEVSSSDSLQTTTTLEHVEKDGNP